jgi:hypothetical protein
MVSVNRSLKMRTAFLLVLGLTLAYPATVASAGSDKVTLHKECTRDRCVYYKGTTRVFSVEKEYGTSRLVVRDGKRRPLLKVEEQDDGRFSVEETDR